MLASYKAWLNDPDLKRTVRWFGALMFVSAVCATLGPHLEPAWPSFRMVIGLIFGAAILLAFPIVISFWERNLRRSKLARAGLIAASLAVPILAAGFFHQWFGMAFPSGNLLLVLDVMFLGGLIAGCVLIAIACFRGGPDEIEN